MQRLALIVPRVLPRRAVHIVDVAQDRDMSRGFARIDLGAPVERQPAGSNRTTRLGRLS
jgi:hypothetical protein